MLQVQNDEGGVGFAGSVPIKIAPDTTQHTSVAHQAGNTTTTAPTVKGKSVTAQTAGTVATPVQVKAAEPPKSVAVSAPAKQAVPVIKQQAPVMTMTVKPAQQTTKPTDRPATTVQQTVKPVQQPVTTPVLATTPAKPAQPATPAKPAPATTPAKPAQVTTPATPAKPADTGKSVTAQSAGATVKPVQDKAKEPATVTPAKPAATTTANTAAATQNNAAGTGKPAKNNTMWYVLAGVAVAAAIVWFMHHKH